MRERFPLLLLVVLASVLVLAVLGCESADPQRSTTTPNTQQTSAVPEPSATAKPNPPEVEEADQSAGLLESIDCDNQLLKDEIIQLSQGNENTLFRIELLKIYEGEETLRTDDRLECVAQSKLSTAEDLPVRYWVEVDEDEDMFVGYRILDEAATVIANPTVAVVEPSPDTNEQPTAVPVPTATPTPTATPVPIHVEISGSGSEVETVNLSAGLYIVQVEIESNENCFFGSCSGTNFIVSIEDLEGGSGSLVNDIASAWSGSTTLRIGTGLFDVGPGTQVVSVDAEGDWSISFDAAFGVEPAASDGNTVTVSGSGTSSRVVSLSEGLHTVEAQVTGNENCFFGSCSGTNFIVSVEGLEEGKAGLVNEIASEWSGSTTFRIGTGLFEVPPGTQVVSVDAEGDWIITFEFLG